MEKGMKRIEEMSTSELNKEVIRKFNKSHSSEADEARMQWVGSE
jgi:hypothetical protein